MWADGQDADFISTGSNQFLIRASGGLGLGVSSPQAQLHLSNPGVDSFPQVRVNQEIPGDYARVRLTVGEDYNQRWDVAARGAEFIL